MAGDPNQLDAVNKSTYASKLGFKTSLMEHLINEQCYGRNPHTSEFDPRYIVQLTENYRNHPIILEIADELFYGGVLKAKAPKGWI